MPRPRPPSPPEPPPACGPGPDSHSSLPSAAFTAMSFDSVCARISFAPPAIIKTGEAYVGLGPLHFHFSLPAEISYATSAPLSRPPSCVMTRPSTIIGELDGKKLGQA